MDNEEILIWRKRIVPEPLPQSTILHFLEPCHYQIYPECRNIGYSYWEIDGLPTESSSLRTDRSWAMMMNQCEEVWTGSSFSKEVFERGGVKVPVHVIPWITHDGGASKVSEPTINAIRLPLWRSSEGLKKRLRPIYFLIGKLPQGLRRCVVSAGLLTTLLLKQFLRLKKAQSTLWRTREAFDLTSQKTFKFLCVNTFLERKNYKDLLSAYFFAFTKEDPVALVIKTHCLIDSWWMRLHIMSQLLKMIDSLKVENAPAVFVILEPLSEQKMRDLFATADTFVSTSHGEGVGGGVLQMMLSGKPPVTNLYSSIRDFCSSDSAYTYNVLEEPVFWDDEYYGMRQKWARLDIMSLVSALRQIYENHKTDDYLKRALRAKERALAYGNKDNVIRHYKNIHRPQSS